MSRKPSSPPPVPRLVIRPAKLGDEGLIAHLIFRLADYEKAPQDCKATPETVRAQLFDTPNPVAHALIAELDGVAVGFALYFLNFSTWLSKPGLYLEDLFVLPEHRRHGAGGALLRTLAEICVERGYGRMEWSCLEWNELAKQQYRKIGAVPMEEWRTWRMTEDALRTFVDGGAAPKPAAEPAPRKSRATKAKAAKQADLLEAEPAPQAAAPPAPEESAEDEDDTVVIYTDGGCRPNPGTGAWAAVLRHRGRVKELVGGESDTTNNRMELLAAIHALEALKKTCVIDMYTDSEYVKKGITSWMAGWKRKGWKNKEGEPVKNQDLWRRLDAALGRHKINWRWVRGHAGDPLNERCDELCSREIDRLLKDKRTAS